MSTGASGFGTLPSVVTFMESVRFSAQRFAILDPSRASTICHWSATKPMVARMAKTTITTTSSANENPPEKRGNNLVFLWFLSIFISNLNMRTGLIGKGIPLLGDFRSDGGGEAGFEIVGRSRNRSIEVERISGRSGTPNEKLVCRRSGEAVEINDFDHFFVWSTGIVIVIIRGRYARKPVSRSVRRIRQKRAVTRNEKYVVMGYFPMYHPFQYYHVSGLLRRKHDVEGGYRRSDSARGRTVRSNRASLHGLHVDHRSDRDGGLGVF